MKTKKNQKQVSIEEYIENYCQEKRIRGRFAVYVSPKTHSNLKTAVRLFASEHHTTTSSLADSIISCHFKEYRELLNDVHEEHTRELLEWLKDRGGSEEPEEQSDDVEQ
ncbi:MAG: DUF3408 domain-containing protein [Dysgonamonadaceae bacterium]|jgi:hypothetical protein|nr:DUF3408 domain-containing protein [Dysgonamonadaceae bacterium]